MTALLDWYGSEKAMSFKPNGWGTTPGRYRVEVTGINPTIAYTVDIVDCGNFP